MAERGRGLAGAARSAVRGAAKAVSRRAGGDRPGDGTAETGRSAPAEKKVPAKKAPAKKVTAKKVTAKKAPVTKAPAKKAPAKKAAAKKAAAKKAAAKETPAKKTPAKKAPVKNAPVKNAPAKKSPAKKIARKEAGARRTPARGTGTAPPASLPVREEEAPWTAEELEAVRAEVAAEVDRLRSEIDSAESQIAELIHNSGDGAGDDQVDSGSKAFEREHEMTIANNARDALAQNEHALERIAAGTYGTCESCGNPIGKRRLQAFPRATLCLSCKQQQERH